MVHRVFAIAAIVSTVLLGVTILLLVASSYDFDPHNHRQHLVSLTEDCHVTVARGRIVFFNNVEYGPYHGSIIQLSDDKGIAHPRIDKNGFGDTWGIYYRHFRWLDSGDVIWTVMISLAYPLVVFAVLPVTWGWCRWHRMHRLRRELSPRVQP